MVVKSSASFVAFDDVDDDDDAVDGDDNNPPERISRPAAMSAACCCAYAVSDADGDDGNARLLLPACGKAGMGARPASE